MTALSRIFNSSGDLIERIKPISTKISNLAINHSPSRKGLINALTFLTICLEAHKPNYKKHQNSPETKVPEIKNNTWTFGQFLYEVEQLVEAYQELAKIAKDCYSKVK